MVTSNSWSVAVRNTIIVAICYCLINVGAAYSLSRPQMKLHVEWRKCLANNDCTKLQSDFSKCADGLGAQAEADADRSAQTEDVLRKEAKQFLEDKTIPEFMDFDTFKEHLTKYYIKKEKEREHLIEYAHHIL